MIATAEPISPAAIAYEDIGSGNPAILNPLSYGISLAGLDAAPGRRAFLAAMAAGSRLVAYDQRGGGGSAAVPPGDWEQRADDLWALADTLGIERAVLYGVFDAGHVVLRAARQQPHRVPGIILTATPPAFGPSLQPTIGRWLEERGEAPDRVRGVLRELGVDLQDATELAGSWLAQVSTERDDAIRQLISNGSIPLPAQPPLNVPALILEPARRQAASGWAAALAGAFSHPLVLRPGRGIESLGAIHAFLSRVREWPA